MTPDRQPPAPPVRPDHGERMTFRWRKWDGGEHWVHDLVYLGSDRWGDWLGQPVGWGSRRPGRVFTAQSPNVTLVPPSGDWVLTVNHDHPRQVRIYIDLAWDVRWSDDDVRIVEGIDMDLDVVRADDGRGVWIDDRDEWDEHRVHYGYPLDIVASLEDRAVELERLVREGAAPFDDASADLWLDRLAALGLPPLNPEPPRLEA